MGDDAAIVEFSFVSRAAPGLPMAVFERLARQTWSANTRLGLTGKLCFRDGRFDQVLEGPRDLVLPLAARIIADPRHGSISIRSFRPIARRGHCTWALAGFGLSAAQAISQADTANLVFLPVAAANGRAVRRHNLEAAAGSS